MRFAASSLALALALPLCAVDAAAYRGAPPPGHANAPPSPRNCTECHDSFSLNAGDVTIRLVDEITAAAMSRYEPGLAYDLRFDIESGEAGRSRWGFQLVPLAGEAMAGELSAGASSQLQSAGGRTYLAHAPAINDPGGASWSFSWTAPADDVGQILFWACGNAANGDGDNEGDYIECASFAVDPGAIAGGALTRVVRWQGEAVDPSFETFASDPCSSPSVDLRLCEEAALDQESIDGALPVSLVGTGRLVFIEHDSDTSTPGTQDLILVSKDPGSAGGLLVTSL